MDTIPDSHRDLLETRHATLATIGPDGLPQLSEVWFLAEDGVVRISLNNTRQKSRNLAANPGCTVFILDLANPYRYLEIRGTAEIAPDDDYTFAGRVGAKYGTDLRVHDGPGETRIAVTVRPKRINAITMGG